jgi:hypothetical protein
MLYILTVSYFVVVDVFMCFLTSFIFSADKQTFGCDILCFGYSCGSTIYPSQQEEEMQTLTLSKKSENIIREAIRCLRGPVSIGY